MTRYFSIDQVAESLSVDRQTVARLLKKSVCETVKVGRLIRIPEGEVEKLFQSSKGGK